MWDITIHPQGFHGDLFSSPTNMDITIHLLRVPASSQPIWTSQSTSFESQRPRLALFHSMVVCSPPQPIWDITIHPLQGPVSSLAFFPSSNRYRTAPKFTPFGASVFTGTPPHVYPLRGTAKRLAHCPMSGSDTICNDTDPQIKARTLSDVWL